MKLVLPGQSATRSLIPWKQAAPCCLLLLCSIALTACGSSRPLRYHSIDLPPRAHNQAAPDPFPVSLIVGHFLAPHIYRENKLVYLTEDNEIHMYEAHRWVEPPTEILENLVVQTLRESGRFRSVQLQRSKARGDFLLRGRLVHFDEITGPRPAARIRLEAELYDINKGTTVWSQTYSAEEPLAGKGVPSMVASLQHATDTTLAALSSGLAEYFSTHPAP